MTNSTSFSSGERGFGLVEALVATLVTTVGVLSVAGLFIAGARMQLNSRNGSAAVGLATWELERIRTLLPTAAERLDGGDLAADVANHWIMRGTTRLRWVITNKADTCAPAGGVPGAAMECAKDIVVVAIPPNRQATQPRVTGILFR
jgi:Tfp pilus assembly protein PilV